MATPSDANDRASGPLILAQLLLGMGLFGTATPLSKIVGEAFPVFAASFARMAIAAACLAPVVIVTTRRFSRTTRSDWIVLLFISAFGMVGFTAAMLYGMRLTTGVIGATIMSATPALTAAGAVLFLGAAMNRRKAAALGLAVAGVLAINLFRRGGDGGDAVVLGAALVGLAIGFEAAYTLLSRKLSDGITSLEATLAASVMALPLFAVLSVLFDPQPFSYGGADRRAWISLLFWGAGTGGLAPVLWYNGARRAPGVLTAGAMAVMPVTALVLSYVLLGERFQWAHAVGFGMVFAGVLLLIREQTRD